MKYIKNFESMHNNWQLLKNPDISISISISIYLYIYIIFLNRFVDVKIVAKDTLFFFLVGKKRQYCIRYKM